jgi:hypothetical protein
MVDLGIIEELYENGSNGLRLNGLVRAKEGYKRQSKMTSPPCYATEGIYSPANPFLFAMLLGAMNLQFCTSYLILRYLAKYIGSVGKSFKS